MKRLPETLFVLSTALLVSLASCDKSGKEGGGDGDDSEAKKPKQADPAALFSGDKPSVPAPFKTLRPGMSIEEATKVFPNIADKGIGDVPEYDGYYFRAYVPKSDPHLENVSISLEKGVALPLLTKAWGKPVETFNEVHKKKIPTWFNPDTGLRVQLEDGFGEDQNVTFTEYIAYKKFLGEAGPAFAFEKSQPLMGATIEQLRAGYPKVLKETSAAQAKKQRADMKKFVGDNNAAKLDRLGAPSPSVQLDFPPTEHESYTTPVHISWKDGKVSRYWFGIAFETYKPAKAEIKAFIEKKLGPGKETKDIMDKPMWVFGEGPYIVLKEDTISEKWDLTVDTDKPRMR